MFSLAFNKAVSRCDCVDLLGLCMSEDLSVFRMVIVADTNVSWIWEFPVPFLDR